jgi:hypothetical protein
MRIGPGWTPIHRDRSRKECEPREKIRFSPRKLFADADYVKRLSKFGESGRSLYKIVDETLREFGWQFVSQFPLRDHPRDLTH